MRPQSAPKIVSHVYAVTLQTKLSYKYLFEELTQTLGDSCYIFSSKRSFKKLLVYNIARKLWTVLHELCIENAIPHSLTQSSWVTQWLKSWYQPINAVYQ